MDFSIRFVEKIKTWGYNKRILLQELQQWYQLWWIKTQLKLTIHELEQQQLEIQKLLKRLTTSTIHKTLELCPVPIKVMTRNMRGSWRDKTIYKLLFLDLAANVCEKRFKSSPSLFSSWNRSNADQDKVSWIKPLFVN